MILIFGECYLTWRWGGESSHPEKVQSFLRGWERIIFSRPSCDYNRFWMIQGWEEYLASRMIAEPGSGPSEVGDGEASRLWQRRFILRSRFATRSPGIGEVAIDQLAQLHLELDQDWVGLGENKMYFRVNDPIWVLKLKWGWVKLGLRLGGMRSLADDDDDKLSLI